MNDRITALIATGIAAVALGFTAGALSTAAAHEHTRLPIESVMAALDTPCPTEDSDTCYWLADTAGNAQGTSFLNVEGNVFPMPELER